VIYAGLGDTDQAITWLKKGYAERFNSGVLLRPGFDTLRSDPRFGDLESRIGLGRVSNSAIMPHPQKFYGWRLPRSSFALAISAPGKAHDGDGRERKQHQYEPVGGIARCETSVGLEQERGENQASHHSDKQARQATPEVTDRNDQQQEHCRNRWF